MSPNETAFLDYAQSIQNDPDAVYTIELLVEHARSEWDEDCYKHSANRDAQRERPDYVPHFDLEHLRRSIACLSKRTWLNLQRVRPTERPIRHLGPLQFLPALTGLFFGENEIKDVSPLRHCRQLKRLGFNKNRVTDISVLAACPLISELVLSSNPITCFSVLEKLPHLRELTVDSGQANAFCQVGRIANLRELTFRGEVPDFENFPEMPELRSLIAVEAADLSGLERYRNLESLINLEGEFKTLQPLRSLKRLSHLGILNCQVEYLEPLTQLYALRVLRIGSNRHIKDLNLVSKLPALHELSVRFNRKELPEVDLIRQSLVSWDVEFFSDKPRYTPSSRLEIVNQEVFDHFDTKVCFGVDGNENVELLDSESEWLREKISEALSIDLVEDEDFAQYSSGHDSRSRTVALLNEDAFEDFASVVLRIQGVLSRSKHDWIIYLQSDAGVSDVEFECWVYPEKIQTTPDNETVLKQLLESKYF